MKLGMMIRDMLRSSTRKPATEFYPAEKRPAIEQFRGLVHWNPELCTGCGLCVKDCPADAIELITLDKANKRFVMHYRADRCIFCGQCVYNCRFGCIQQSAEDWELARHDRSLYDIFFGRPEDLEQALADADVPSAEPLAG